MLQPDSNPGNMAISNVPEPSATGAAGIAAASAGAAVQTGAGGGSSSQVLQSGATAGVNAGIAAAMPGGASVPAITNVLSGGFSGGSSPGLGGNVGTGAAGTNGGFAGGTGLAGGNSFAPANTSTAPSTQSYNTATEEPVSAAAAASTYEEIAWEISVDGTAIKRLLSFELTQGMSTHHRFELRLYHTELEDPRTYRIDKTKSLLGKNLTAVLGTHVKPDITRFTGIITEVAFEEKTGLYGEVILRGASPTILLEGGPNLHSFYNKNLSKIVQETLQAAGGKLETSVSPRFTGNIEYTVQHVESHFEFIKRLAQLHGEWAFYDGEKFHFGRPSKQPEQQLQYARHLQSLRMSMQAVAMNFEGIGYRATDDQPLNKTAPKQVPGLNYYGDTAVQSSDSMYATPVRHYPRLHATDQGSLDRITQVAKAAKAAETFSVHGVSRHPSPRPGLRLTVNMGNSEMGQYLVTEAVHRLDNVKQYSCTFTALAADVETLPVPEADLLTLPHTEAQIAVVKDNADPAGQGRVRAQFLWQSGDNMTPWMRVSTPDAGGGGGKVAKNRGFVFVPEVGDQVIVGFEAGNPDAPFVLASLFHGKTGSGGGSGNNTKSMTTRSGINLTLDDSSGSAKLEDPSGNIVTLNGDGTITIHAPTRIDMTSVDISIAASNSLSLTGTNSLTAGAITTGINGSTTMMVTGATVGVQGGTVINLGAPTLNATGQTATNVSGAKIAVSGGAEVGITGGIVKINS